MCEPIMPIWITAYHEAGHAVVAALQRKKTEGEGGSIRFAVPFKYVTIRPKPNKRGAVGHVVMSSKYCIDPDLIVLLAGACAVSRFTHEKSRFNGCSSDLGEYFRILDGFVPEESEREAIIDGTMKQCHDEVIRAWPAIEDVAHDLLEKGTLTKKEVEARCKEHGLKYNRWVFAVETRDLRCAGNNAV